MEATATFAALLVAACSIAAARATVAAGRRERRALAQCTKRSAKLADGAPRLQQQPRIRRSRTSTATTVKDLKLKFLISIGGTGTGGTLRGKEEATPLVDDGFMYVVDTWSRVMKFDVRSGTQAVPLWRYDPKITRSRTSRGIAMYGNKVFVATNDARLIALNRDSGEVVWEVNAAAPTDPATGTPSLEDARLLGRAADGQDPRRQGARPGQGESTGGSAGHPRAGSAPGTPTPASWPGAPSRSRRRASPAPRPGRTSTMPGASAAASVWQTASYDPGHQPRSITAPATPSRASIRNSARATTCSPRARIALDADTGKIAWYFQETPNEHWDFDTPSPKMLYEVTINGEQPQGRRELLAQRLLLHARPRQRSVPARRPVSGESHLDQGHRSEDRQAGRLRSEPRRADSMPASACGAASPARRLCPWWNGSPTFFPPTYDAKRMRRLCGGRRRLHPPAPSSRPRWTRTRTMSACRRAAPSRAAPPPTARSGRSICKTGKVHRQGDVPARRTSPAC